MARIRYTLDENSQWDDELYSGSKPVKTASPTKPRGNKELAPKTHNMDAVRKLIVKTKRNIE